MLWKRNVPTWQVRCLAISVEKTRLASETIVYLGDFVGEKRAGHICAGFVIFTLGQDDFWFVVQNAVQLFLQLFLVVRVVVDDVSIEITLCFVDDSGIFTDLASQL